MNRETAGSDYEIREITGQTFDTSVTIVGKAFGVVTEEFGITRENCPRFPAYTTVEELEEKRDRGARFFGAFVDGKQVGIILVEKEEDGRYFAKRLAVLPEYWHRGLGEGLMNRAIECTRDYGATEVNIGMVNEHTVLKNWYLAMGFQEVAVEKIDYLPFDVGFLKKDITDT